MSAVTYAPKSFTNAPRPVGQPAKGFFRRLLDAIIAARMAQAERELALYLERNGRDPIL